MKRLLVLPLLLLCIQSIHAQHVSRKNPWFDGYIVSYENDTTLCKMRFTKLPAESLIQVQDENRIKIFTVQDVQAFAFYDQVKKRNRNFYTGEPLNQDQKPSRLVFIEKLYSNERFTIINYKTWDYARRKFQFNPFKKKCVVNQTFVLDTKTNSVLPLSKENILALMNAERVKVQTYIQSHGVRFRRLSDFIATLEYHKTIL